MKDNEMHNDGLEQRLNEAWKQYDDKESIAAVPASGISRVKKRIDDIIEGIEARTLYMRRLRRWRVMTAVAAGVAVLMGVVALWPLMSVHEEERVDGGYATVVTGEGERATVVLPDGTRVTLNQNSRFAYQATIATDSVREVELSGEAYFNVMHAANRPFNVEAEGLTVRVTGTEFNVEAYDNQEMATVSLDRGSVLLSSDARPNAIVSMQPGDVAGYDRATGKITLLQQRAGDATAWMRHQVAYYDVTPDSLIRSIEGQYGVRLAPEACAMINERFTGSLPDDDLAETLAILGKLYRFDVTHAIVIGE